DLPERTVPLPPSGMALKVVRGPELPPQEQWTKNWLALARWEAAKGNLPDAIDAASRALELIRQGDSPAERAAVRAERAEILNVRAQYHLLNHALRAARDDWQQALSLGPSLSEPANRLARLYLLGPPELRDPDRALTLLAGLAERQDPPKEQQVLLAIAHL